MGPCHLLLLAAGGLPFARAVAVAPAAHTASRSQLPALALSAPHDLLDQPALDALCKFRDTAAYLGSEADRIDEALHFSAHAHSGQLRRSGSAFIVHPIETATILADLRMDCDTIIAGLLHDTVEDTAATLPQIDELFGSGVAAIVAGVTDSSALPAVQRDRHRLLAMSSDWRVVIVKLADRLHNMRTLEAMPRAKRQRKAQETLRLYVPLARRLGVSSIERELSQHSARHLFRQRIRAPLEAIGMLAGASDLLTHVAEMRCPAALDQMISHDRLLASMDVDAELSAHRWRWAQHALEAGVASG